MFRDVRNEAAFTEEYIHALFAQERDAAVQRGMACLCGVEVRQCHDWQLQPEGLGDQPQDERVADAQSPCGRRAS